MPKTENMRRQTRRFLMQATGTEMADFLLARHETAANMRRQLFDLLDDWVEQAAEARVVAEVNAIRRELKESLAIPFRKKVEQAAAHGETPTLEAPFEVAQHRRAYLHAMGIKTLRQ